ncbi:ABC transporter permease [Algoriphagus terrigena]|uniref:ABC transporter permease n=1 Tax=Algoriphagus terrigena TaxID=344884 RepID=UPI000401DFCD|nr:ABC transporter permease [Algoriphagus terrigena]
MKKEAASPPGVFLLFFRWYCHPRMRDYIEGDLMEVYDRRVKESGKRKADWKFILDVLLLFRPGIIRPRRPYQDLNTYGMYKSYFKIGWRNLLRDKGFSLINVGGLAMGMAVAMLIGLWIWDEVSFDSYFEDHDRLAKVMLNQTDQTETSTDGTIATPLEDALRTLYPDDFERLSLISWNSDRVVIFEDKKLSAQGRWVQRDFPEMFTLTMLSGSRQALKDPSSVFISASVAKAIFGEADPINQAIRIDNELDMTVAGVFEDFPKNTTFYSTNLLLPWDNQANRNNRQTSWSNHSCELFVLLSEKAGDVTALSEKVKNVPTPHITKIKEEILLHPLDKLHLYDEFENGKAAGGRIEFIWLFGTIGAFVLLLACINFMNLSTARSEKRAKEVGIRKAIGSIRQQLITQFLCESMVVALLAFVLSLCVTRLALPFFNAMAEKQMQIPWNSPEFWGMLLGFVLITGIVSGSYPAFYLSAFKPISVLKGTFRVGRFAQLPRNVLVVIQFTVSITLIIAAIIVFRQIEHAKSRVSGYSREGLVTVNINTPDLDRHYEVVKDELLRAGVVAHMSKSSYSPAHFSSNNGLEWPGKDPELSVNFRNVNVTPEFGQTLGWEIVDGRDFLADSHADSAAVIFNETAIKIMGLQNPLGEPITFGGKQYTIVGITEDMVTQSPYAPIEPTMFFTDGWKGVILMRLNAEASTSESLAKMDAIFTKYNPNAPFQYNFVDDVYARKYATEESIGTLAAFFAVLAIFISCLGLFGLASFVAEQRTKELGIRKVLGASILNLWGMLSREFVLLVVISCSISIPIAFWFMDNWLLQFEYKTTMSWQIFAAVIFGAVVITLLTVSFQTVKAALSNPVRSLKSE